MPLVYNEDTGNYDWMEDEPAYTPPVAPQLDNPAPGWYGLPENSPNPNGYMDLAYWQSRAEQLGTPTSIDDIFDTSTGQLRPGWARTERGYEQVGTGTSGGPPPDPYPKIPTTYGGYGGGSQRTLPPLNLPSFNAPRFNAPPPFQFDPFSYEAFKAPTLAEAQSEPGFDYALNQGIKAFENSKAYLGTYKTGATIKGLNDYARNMANQNYDRVFDRAGQTYDRNRGNAFGTWSANRANAADTYVTNYGISRDVFDRNYTASKDEYGAASRNAELQAARDWDVFAYEGDDTFRRWKATLDANSY